MFTTSEIAHNEPDKVLKEDKRGLYFEDEKIKVFPIEARNKKG